MGTDHGAGGSPVPRTELSGPVLEVAPRLLGCLLTHDGVTVRLTEVEAYAGTSDPGSHAYRGPTARTGVMFGPAGHLYVYLSHGLHCCANIVTGASGTASAVLLRAGEVVAGIPLARRRRQQGRSSPVPDRDLARGPGNLGRALGLDRRQDGLDLCGPGSAVSLTAPWGRVGPEGPGPADGAPPAAGTARPVTVRTGPRVGVSGEGGSAELFPWRFWLAGEATVSAYRAAAPRRAESRSTSGRRSGRQ
ncbi:DNA-3-methyladenine glycosylase [uncultured Serinicoccus sp.]|uniref:DNA-3-methyladenine glycosylase n=1 Tax=uncultured Serinicoccus sp. TaxID=735514 RepID=UPI0026113A04|nr:DNA-3-methyladenine glycosylase [uncultured Serinicoccus sp.]